MRTKFYISLLLVCGLVAGYSGASYAQEQTTTLSPTGLLAQRMAAYVENMRAAINKSTLPSQDKERLTGQINQDLSVLQRENATLYKAKSREARGAQKQKLKQFWEERSTKMHYYLGLLLTARSQARLDQMRTMVTTAQELIKQLGTYGIPSTDFTAKLAAIASQLDAIQTDITAASSVFTTSAPTSMPTKEGIQKGFESIRASHQKMQQARKDFRELISAIRSQLPRAPLNTNETNQ